MYRVCLRVQGMQDGGPVPLPIASTLTGSAVGAGSMPRASLRATHDEPHAADATPQEAVAAGLAVAPQPTWADRTAATSIPAPAGSTSDGASLGGGGGAAGAPAAGSTGPRCGRDAPAVAAGEAAATRVGLGRWSSQLAVRMAGSLGAAGGAERVPRGGEGPQEGAGGRNAVSPPAVVEAMVESSDGVVRPLRRSQSFHQDDSRRRGGSQDGRGDAGSPYHAPRSERASRSEAGHVSASARRPSGGGAGDVPGQGPARREGEGADGDGDGDVAVNGGDTSPNGRLSFKV